MIQQHSVSFQAFKMSVTFDSTDLFPQTKYSNISQEVSATIPSDCLSPVFYFYLVMLITPPLIFPSFSVAPWTDSRDTDPDSDNWACHFQTRLCVWGCCYSHTLTLPLHSMALWLNFYRNIQGCTACRGLVYKNGWMWEDNENKWNRREGDRTRGAVVLTASAHIGHESYTPYSMPQMQVCLPTVLAF